MKRMQFDEFSNLVVERVKDFLPEEFKKASVSLQVVTKANDVKLTGLTISSVQSNVAPTIYLESFYEKYEDGEDIDAILKRIAEVRLEHEVANDFDASLVTDFDRCKHLIVPRLVSVDMNMEMLERRPHMLMDELAVFYCIHLDCCKEGTASIAITNDILKMWDMDIEELHELAVNNLPSVLPSTFKGMNEVMMEMTGMEFPEVDEKMFVLSNVQKVNGASALLDKEIMNAVIERVGTDFYILPSSLHEVLIVPADAGMDVSDLEAMVQEVNATQVSVEDKLSDHVFKYSADQGIFRA